jgi:hypothetical protein
MQREHGREQTSNAESGHGRDAASDCGDDEDEYLGPHGTIVT